MLTLQVPPVSYWDEAKEEFIEHEGLTLNLEHSLYSISKWESKWLKAYLKNTPKSAEEAMDYVKCMSIEDISIDDLDGLGEFELEKINEYINAPMSATYINTPTQTGYSSETTTSELIYYWMVEFHIPFECQHWHLNRLLKLISVCNIKKNPPKKRSQREIAAENKAINDRRRIESNTNG